MLQISHCVDEEHAVEPALPAPDPQIWQNTENWLGEMNNL